MGGTFARYQYTLDAVGNRLGMVDNEGTTTYRYDALYRLAGVTYPGGTEVSYRDPAVGRFISRDPFPGFAFDPLSQQPYVYGRNNPVNRVDPSGLQGGPPTTSPPWR